MLKQYKLTSYVKSEKVYFLWEIDNFQAYPAEPNTCLDSSVFQWKNASWFIRIYPNESATKANTGDVSVYIMHLSPDIDRVVRYKVGLRDKYGKECFTNEDMQRFYCDQNISPNRSQISRITLINEKKEQLLPDGVLTVFCELSTEPTITHDNMIEENQRIRGQNFMANFENLSRDLKMVLKDKSFTDVTLKVGNREFSVHKTILKARSCVFAAMFTHDMTENRSRVVKIDDMEEAAMEDMLEYIYTGKVSGMSCDKAISLFAAADKYALDELKTICIDAIENNLSLDQLGDVAVLAYTYDDKQLEEAVEVLLTKIGSELYSTNQWKSFVLQRPDLTSKILESFIMRKNYNTNESQ